MEVEGDAFTVGENRRTPTRSQELTKSQFGSKISNSEFPSGDSSSEDESEFELDQGLQPQSSNLQDDIILDSSPIKMEDNVYGTELEENAFTLDIDLEAYEASDSEEKYDIDFDYNTDRLIYGNEESIGYKTAKTDEYSGLVYEFKYSGKNENLERLRRRSIFANKLENKIFSTERSTDDLKRAEEVNINDKTLSKKLYRHPDFFDFKKPPKTKSQTPKRDFF